MAYEDFKDLAKKKAASDKVLRDEVFNIAKNPKYDGYETGLASIEYKFFDKKCLVVVLIIRLKKNQQLANELHKPIIRKLNKEEFIFHIKITFGVLI